MYSIHSYLFRVVLYKNLNLNNWVNVCYIKKISYGSIEWLKKIQFKLLKNEQTAKLNAILLILENKTLFDKLKEIKNFKQLTYFLVIHFK